MAISEEEKKAERPMRTRSVTVPTIVITLRESSTPAIEACNATVGSVAVTASEYIRRHATSPANVNVVMGCQTAVRRYVAL
jgi:hypothetical protein